MYPNLRAEMAREKVSMAQIASVANKTEDAIRKNVRGIGSFSVDEVFKIRDGLFPNCTIEYLFKKEEKE